MHVSNVALRLSQPELHWQNSGLQARNIEAQVPKTGMQAR
jgi:hypothetical protein